MIQKLIKGMVVGGALMALVAPAHADQEINIFGASAQYKYWSQGAPNFLMSTAVGCDADDVWSADGDLEDRDNGISVCHADLSLMDESGDSITTGSGSSVYDGEDIVIRYSTFASVEGILAALEENPSDADADDCGTYGDGYRLMADPTTATMGNTGNGDDAGTVTSLECVDVSMGTSDIDPECFTQSTYGPAYYGVSGMEDYSDWTTAIGDGSVYAPDDTDSWWVREFYYGDTVPVPSEYDVESAQPLIVPFAFFVNDENPLIYDSSTSAVANTMNLTRPMAQMLLSGSITNWSAFDSSVDEAVAICIRHAGSGTHATTDWAVVNPYTMAQVAIHEDNPLAMMGIVVPTYTNKGSSQEIACVAGIEGAIGYADADKKGDLYDGDADSVCGSGVCRTQYQGYWATRENVVNGLYDYWAANIVFYDLNDGEFDEELIADFISFMEDPDNLEGTGKEEFWASQDEMNFERSSCKDGITPK